MKIVWVLGSGFSVGLGGPTLDQLFEEHRLQSITHLHASRVTPKQERILRVRRHSASIYDAADAFNDDTYEEFEDDDDEESDDGDKWAKVYQERLKPVRDFYAKAVEDKWSGWRNAEEFVELLDLAASQDMRSIFLLRARTKFAGEFTPGERTKYMNYSRDARAYLAAVCSEFITPGSASTERWQPYRRWASLLSPSDTVVTFNYDLVVETACDMANVDLRHCVRFETEQTGRLCKMHGSVDWTSRGTQLEKVDDPIGAIISGKEIAIGIPGPQKKRHSEELFALQWDEAEKTLATADVIVFVGYRFPPTDSDAKQRILSAIAKNPHHHLTIRLVLGPKRDESVERLLGLLRWALADRYEHSEREYAIYGNSRRWISLIHEPLWAEDFMTVFDRDRLSRG